MVGVATTDQNPEEETEVLSKSIHLPTPFIVVYQKPVSDCAHAKKFVHDLLIKDSKGSRKIKDIEFFIVSTTDAIDGVVEYLKKEAEDKNDISNELEYPDSNYDEANSDDDFSDNNDVDDDYNDDEETPLYVMEENLGYYYQYGKNGYIQDPGEAMYHYKLAVKYGSISAYSDIGMMYYYGEGVRKNRTTALRYLNDGVRKGSYKCYFNMTTIYFLEGEYENAVKAFNLAMKFCQDSEKVYGCVSYIQSCVMFKIPITLDVVEIMKPYAQDIWDFSMQQCKNHPEIETFKQIVQYIEDELL